MAQNKNRFELVTLKSLRSPSDIGGLIYYLRKKRDLTQKELSQMTGIKQQTISAIENGIQNAELKTLFSILATLNLELVVRPREQRTRGFVPGYKSTEVK